VQIWRKGMTAAEGNGPYQAPVRQLPSWQMVRTLEYMNVRGKSKFSAAELCEEIGISASGFIQLFKNSVNSISPHVYYKSPHRRQSAEVFGGRRFVYKRCRVPTWVSERKPLL